MCICSFGFGTTFALDWRQDSNPNPIHCQTDADPILCLFSNRYTFQHTCIMILYKNIPILPEAFLTFASKSSVGPSYAANGQEDYKTCTNLKDDNISMVYDCYFDSISQCPGVLRNVHVYCAISQVKVNPYGVN